jgi:1-deoxy-D-xylulose-5-phosphate reductoisomerase
MALASSPLHPAVLNAANETLVEAFLAGQLPFNGIVGALREVVQAYVPSQDAGGVPTVEEIERAQQSARAQATQLLERWRTK